MSTSKVAGAQIDAALAAQDRLVALIPDLVRYLAIFLGEDERFHIAIGGNPYATDKMLAAARATLAKARGE